MAKRFRSPMYLGDQVRSMVRPMLRSAIADLEEVDDDAEEVVHDVRKTCKRVRGVVRLVRPGLGGHYRRANEGCRDAARQLSPLRDQHALLETFDALVAADHDRLPPGGLGTVRAALVADADRATQVIEPGDPRVAAARHLLAMVLDGVGDWPDVDAVDAVGGIATTFGRGRRAMDDVVDDPTTDRLHEWRKRVKYLWYQVQVVRDAAPSLLRPLVDNLHQLSDALGDDHDLGVLVERIRADPQRFGSTAERDGAISLAERRRADLQSRALSLGRRLYVESDDAFADRICGYLTVWEDGRERRTGALAVLAPPTDGLDDLSTTALRREARRREIRGRTVLARPDLLAAIRIHPAPGRATQSGR